MSGNIFSISVQVKLTSKFGIPDYCDTWNARCIADCVEWGKGEPLSFCLNKISQTVWAPKIYSIFLTDHGPYSLHL
jgi:hypothetical protein